MMLRNLYFWGVKYCSANVPIALQKPRAYPESVLGGQRLPCLLWVN